MFTGGSAGFTCAESAGFASDETVEGEVVVVGTTVDVDELVVAEGVVVVEGGWYRGFGSLASFFSFI